MWCPAVWAYKIDEELSMQCRGDVQVVSLLAFYSYDPSSILGGVNYFYCWVKSCLNFEKIENKRKRGPGMANLEVSEHLLDRLSNFAQWILFNEYDLWNWLHRALLKARIPLNNILVHHCVNPTLHSDVSTGLSYIGFGAWQVSFAEDQLPPGDLQPGIAFVGTMIETISLGRTPAASNKKTLVLTLSTIPMNRAKDSK